MLMRTFNCLTKSRPFRTPLLFSNPFSSISRYPSPLPTRPPPISSYILDLEPKQVCATFKDWFKLRQRPLLERIFQIFSSRDDEDPSSVEAADLALSQLGLRLSERFVLEVLRYKDHDALFCLKFFYWAGRQRGFYHTKCTFAAIFKILSRPKHMHLMLDFLDSCSRDKHINRGSVYDTLVMGYAAAGKPYIALQLFGRMRFGGLDLDPFSYNVLLNGLVEASCFDGMDIVLSQIIDRGYEDEYTRAILMKSLCKRLQLEEAGEFLRGLVGSGKVVDGHMLGLLVDALCKNNMFADVGRLMDEFRDMGCVPMAQAYGVWIRHLVQAGSLDSALEFLHSKNFLEGYVPDVFCYNILVSKLLRENRVEEVYDMLTEMNENQIVPDTFTINTAMCFLCKVGLIDVAIELFQSRSEYGLTPISMAYNYMINTLCGDGSIDEAYHIMKNAMDDRCFPGKRTFSILFGALRREGKIDKMIDMFLVALKHNCMPSNTYERLISALCQAQRVEDAYLILCELNRFNKVLHASTYTRMIYGFINSKKRNIVARLFLDMQEKGHTPSRSLFRDVIHCICDVEDPRKQLLQLLELQLSYHQPSTRIFNYYIMGAGYIRQPDLAREIYERMLSSGYIPVLGSDILMLQSYLKNERISDAVNFFHEVSQKRRIGRKFYNAMIVGLCKVSRSDIALLVFEDVKKRGLIPSLECYEELIKLLSAEKEIEKVKMLINDLEAVGRCLSPFIGNVLLLCSLKNGGLYEAWHRTRDPNNEARSSVLLGQMLAAFSHRIKTFSDVKDLEKVIQGCFPLDLFSYNMLLRKLCKDQIDIAFDLLKEMHHRGYEPDRWTYDILVHGLVRRGRNADARRWMDEMLHRGFTPTEGTSSLV